MTTQSPTVIAIGSLKGGVGKSMTAWMLARHLHARGLRTLAIDLDPGASLTRWSGVVNRIHVGHVLGGAVTPSAGIRLAAQISDCDVHVVPSHIDVSNVAHGLHTRQFNRVEALHNAILATGNDWDVAIIDAPGGSDVLLINAIYAADLVIVPSQPEDASIAYTRQTLDYIAQTVRAKHEDIDAWVIATMVQYQTIGHRDGLDRLNQVSRIVTTIPQRKGENADSELYSAYSGLAADVVGYVRGEQHHAAYRPLADKIARLIGAGA